MGLGIFRDLAWSRHPDLLQSLEHEMGGVKVYETALKCAISEELKEE